MQIRPDKFSKGINVSTNVLCGDSSTAGRVSFQKWMASRERICRKLGGLLLGEERKELKPQEKPSPSPSAADFEQMVVLG